MFSSKCHIRLNCGVNTMFSAKNTHSGLVKVTFQNEFPRANETWTDTSSRTVDENAQATQATQQASIAASISEGCWTKSQLCYTLGRAIVTCLRTVHTHTQTHTQTHKWLRAASWCMSLHCVEEATQTW